MNLIQSSSQAVLPDGEDPAFLFSSRNTLLRAEGVAQTLDIALADTAFADGTWDATVQQTFRRLRESGVDNPIVVGAVPFDLDRPARLFVPERYERAAAESALETPADNTTAGGIAALHEEVDQAAYEEAVRQAIALMETTPLRKAVLSRALDVVGHDAFDARRLVRALLRQNPGAHVFSVPLDAGQTLIGASPELLLRKTGDRILSNPLAGSAKRGGGDDRDWARVEALLTSEKDRVEHQYVVTAVGDALAPYCPDLAVPEAPRVISTPTMWHLSTEVEGTLADPTVHALRLARALHPTPAICGTPTDLAAEAINRLEGYDRGWYSGMVGWMDSRGNGEWALTIRCGVVEAARLRLFAGAGIVAASRPEDEWRETAAKLTTMLNVFGVGTRAARRPGAVA